MDKKRARGAIYRIVRDYSSAIPQPEFKHLFDMMRKANFIYHRSGEAGLHEAFKKNGSQLRLLIDCLDINRSVRDEFGVFTSEQMCDVLTHICPVN